MLYEIFKYCYLQSAYIILAIFGAQLKTKSKNYLKIAHTFVEGKSTICIF